MRENAFWRSIFCYLEEKIFMILKIGTLKDLDRNKEKMPEEVFRHLHYSIELLEENYGAERDIDHDDGGYILFFDSMEDLAQIRTSGMLDFTYHVPEWVDRIKTAKEDYGAALYLTSNDFGIILAAPVNILSMLPDIEESLQDS